jgi:hypothetical protein
METVNYEKETITVDEELLLEFANKYRELFDKFISDKFTS